MNPPTQDELPYKAFAGSSLSAKQIYKKKCKKIWNLR